MKFLTAGESHGKGLVAILDGLPSNLIIDSGKIQAELQRRKCGYGRGGRMKIESDNLEVYSGIRGGKTLGSPVAFVIPNADYKNWETVMSAFGANPDSQKKALTKLRPGHADYAGCIKYGHTDARNILERASARETAARVGIGAFCRQLLEQVGITIGSHVTKIGGVVSNFKATTAINLNQIVDSSPVRCGDQVAEKLMIKAIDNCTQNGDTLGGEIELIISGVPIGVGSHSQFDRKLDYVLCGFLGGIQAVKCVSIGDGERAGDVLGSEFHDEMELVSDCKTGGKIIRKSNNAGGIEGGISNGESIIIHLVFKPIPTLMKGLNTVDIVSNTSCIAAPERSDYCAVPAGGVVAEAVAAYAIASELLLVTGGDTFDEVKTRVDYMRARGIK